MASIVVSGDTSGSITLSAPAVSGSSVLTLPAVTDTVAGIAATQTLTNKTLTSPSLTTPNIDSAQFATVSGTAPIYPCRAWVNFNGTSTVAIRASGNMSSITDNGTGDYTVNFTTALPDGNYAPVISSNNNTTNLSVSNDNDYASTRTTTAYRFAHLENATPTDASVLCVAIFR